MFTGIVERTARVVAIEHEGTNVHFTLTIPFADELAIDQSMAHDGCCLTIVKLDKKKKEYVVTAMEETMQKTNLATWQVGTEVNIERAMRIDGRLDGHIVQGCTRVEDCDGSWRYYFDYEYRPADHNITVAKGSITVNGVSLTVVDSQPGHFSVSIIPYTHQITNFHNIKAGTTVNIEFDVLGKYVLRLMEAFKNEM